MFKGASDAVTEEYEVLSLVEVDHHVVAWQGTGRSETTNGGGQPDTPNIREPLMLRDHFERSMSWQRPRLLVEVDRHYGA